jgi:hypothetical protein
MNEVLSSEIVLNNLTPLKINLSQNKSHFSIARMNLSQSETSKCL